MKLLFDANIFYRIVKKLQKDFSNSLHVSRTGLNPPISDRMIWQFARQNDFLIVTYDEDFYELSNLYGSPLKSFGCVLVMRLFNLSLKGFCFSKKTLKISPLTHKLTFWKYSEYPIDD